MLTATGGLPAGVVSAVALVIVVAAAFAVGVVYLSRRQQATSALQTDTITAFEAANQIKTEQIRDLDTKVALLEERNRALESRLAVTEKLVTQKANVDQLRGEMDEAFQNVNAKLDRLAAR